MVEARLSPFCSTQFLVAVSAMYLHHLQPPLLRFLDNICVGSHTHSEIKININARADTRIIEAFRKQDAEDALKP